jgi:Ca-activated chloride channel homolog
VSLAALSLARPWWLLALLPLAGLVWHAWRAPQRNKAAWQGLIDAHLLPHLLVLSKPGRRRFGLALFAAGLLAAVLALAGPVLDQPPPPAYRPDVTRVVVLELSPAMTAQLEQVKLKLLAALHALPDGQTALLVYGGEPYLVVPPTTDIETIALFVPELAIDAIPVPGNHPERALAMAGETLARSAAQQREILWITTGAALPLPELPSAMANVRLSILQTATADNPALATIARRSGGTLIQLRPDDSDIRQLVSTPGVRSGWTKAAVGAGSGGADLGYWLLLPLLPLAALAFRSGILTLLLPLLPPLILAGLLAPPPASAFDLSLPALLADYQGWRLLAAGEPEAAAARFADPRWRAVAHYRTGQFEQAASLLATGRDADSYYNRGNALARQGQLADALAAYDAALKLRADDADAKHNRDLVQRLLNQQSPPPNGGAGKGAPPQANSGAMPPTPKAGPRPANAAEREASQVADQWLRRIPDQPGTLLRRKLVAEQRRRQANAAERK